MKFLLALFISLIFSCASKQHSNFNIADFWGTELLTGKKIQFSKIKDKSDIILNVYAPNCPPCLKELETLEYLYEKTKKNPNIAFFMIVEPKTALDRVGVDTKNMSSQELSKKIQDLMKKEVQKYKISLPVVIMEEPFKISQDSLVSGMPETLLFTTSPFVLYYNFIGPIGIESEIEKIKQEQKVIFFENMLGIREL